MTTLSNGKATIIRTERGLTISGTRITIYDVIDHLNAGWTPQLIAHWLPLSEEQINLVLSYIKAHPVEIEAEYRAILRENQEIRQYWDKKNRDRLDQIAKLPPKPGQEEMHAKLQVWKAQLGLTS